MYYHIGVEYNAEVLHTPNLKNLSFAIKYS